jgi:hypothetical protein
VSFAGAWRMMTVAPALLLAGCGYHIAGKANLLPANLHTIAVAPWGNASVRYKLSNYLAASVSRELIARTRYRLVSDPSKADLVLYGSIANMLQGGSPLYDNATNRTTAGNVVVYLQVKLVDRSGKTLIDKPGLVYQEPYEISIDPRQYFDESDAAFQRLSAEVAKSVVSAMLEQF